MLSSLTSGMLNLRKINGIIESICTEAPWLILVKIALFVKDLLWRIYKEVRWLNLVIIALYGDESSLEWMPQLLLHLTICILGHFYSFVFALFLWSLILLISRKARQQSKQQAQEHLCYCTCSQQ